MNNSRHVDFQVGAQLILAVACAALAGLFFGNRQFAWAGFDLGLLCVNLGLGIANYIKANPQSGHPGAAESQGAEKQIVKESI